MLVEVAVPLPIPRTFVYRLEAEREVGPGTRVLVPVQRRRMVGWVVGPAAADRAADGVRRVERLLETEPSIPADLLRLCRWVADYYAAPLGMVLRSALPGALSRRGRPAPRPRTLAVLRLTDELPSLSRRDEAFARAPRQRECFELVESLGGSAEAGHLRDRYGFSSAVLNGLVRRGLAELIPEERPRDPFATETPAPPAVQTPSPAQQAALDVLLAAARPADGGGLPPERPRQRDPEPAGAASSPRPFLLHGVTGSGKTLVYLEVLEEVVRRQGRGAIVLVPEIALTPQTVARFRARFGDDVAVLHSALSDGERYDAWRALREGRRRIAVGARSAVFAPVPDLGAVIVDEEHESSYKQTDAPRYHAREVAVVRAGMHGAVCVLGSATPSLESWTNARRGKFRLLELPERVERLVLPAVRVVDLRGSAAPVLSPELSDALADRLARREQTILLLNRRGYASFVQCRDCGEVWRCARCSVSLTYHRARRRLVCHYCFHAERPPALCDRCGGETLAFRGLGTEQVERTVAETFPAARIARMDVDTTSGKWAHQRILDRVERGEVDVLLGTQMIAKGLDFPGVTLVGVVNADVALNLPDFRAGERTFQLLTQVAGRAGRGPKGGEVIVQTALPTHYAIRAAVTHDFAAFARHELEERRGPGYPPHRRLANIVVSGRDQDAVRQAAEDLATWVRRHLEAVPRVELTGPAPCPVERVRDRWRWHFLLRSVSPASLGRVCTAIHQDFAFGSRRGALRLAIDRDPVALL